MRYLQLLWCHQSHDLRVFLNTSPRTSHSHIRFTIISFKRQRRFVLYGKTSNISCALFMSHKLHHISDHGIMSSALLKAHLRQKMFESISLTIRANDEWMRRRLAQRNARGATIWQRLDQELRIAEDQWQHRLTTAALRQRYQRLLLKPNVSKRKTLPSTYWTARLLHVGSATRVSSMLARC